MTNLLNLEPIPHGSKFNGIHIQSYTRRDGEGIHIILITFRSGGQGIILITFRSGGQGIILITSTSRFGGEDGEGIRYLPSGGPGQTLPQQVHRHHWRLKYVNYHGNGFNNAPYINFLFDAKGLCFLIS